MSDTTPTDAPDETLRDYPSSADWVKARQNLARFRDQRDALQEQLDSRVAAEAETRREHEATLNQMRAEHEADLNALRAELTFTKAGVDLDSLAGQSFVRTYEGEMDPTEVAQHYARFLDASAREAIRYASSPAYASTHTITNGDDDADR